MKPRNKTFSAFAVLTFIFGLVLSGCAKPSPSNENNDPEVSKATVQFGIAAKSNASKSINSSGIQINSYSGTITGVVVTVVDEAGNIVPDWEDRTIPMRSFGDSYVTEPLLIQSGSYKISEFQVVDDSNVIYASPLEDSDKAHLVTDPLTIDFVVTPNTLTVVTPEVLSVEDSVPGDFGYDSFKFEVVETFAFFVQALVYDEVTGNYESTSAHVKVTSGSVTLYDKDVAGDPSKIWVKDISSDYEVVVSLDSYPDWSQTYTPSDLRETTLLVNFSPPSYVPDGVIDGVTDFISTSSTNPVLVESNGNLVVFYNDIDATFSNIKRANYIDGAWEVSTPFTGKILSKDAVVVDDQGAFHIGLADFTTHEVSYAQNTTGSFVTVPVTGVIGYHLSIDLDENKKAHLAVDNYDNKVLTYAQNTSGSFVSNTISTSCLGWPSIMVNSSNDIDILYYYWSGRDLYISNSNDWTAHEQIGDWSVDGGRRSQLKSFNGHKYTAYSYLTSATYEYSRLMIATDATGSWVNTQLEASIPRIPAEADIAIDENENLNVILPEQNNIISLYSNRTGEWKKYIIVNDYQNNRVDTLVKDGRIYIIYVATDNTLKITSIDPLAYN